jgi:predicted nucleic-acid-binding Zn-ribbon protein
MGFAGKGKIFDVPDKINGVHSFSMVGKNILCPHCGSETFEQKTAMLNTAWMTFFNLDWANKQAIILTCSKCTYVQWFLQQPEVLS